MNYSIKGTEYYLPSRLIGNDFFVNECGIDRDFLEHKVGIRQRYFASDDETTLDMAVKAAGKVIASTGIDRETIDLVVLVTENPDYRIPTTACLLQDRLGLSKSVAAFDITLGCSGYIYGIATAGAYVKAGMAKNALVVVSDEYSKILDYRDRATGPIFGDAAAASIVQPCEDGYGVIDVNFGTDGGGAPYLICYNSGLKKDPDKPGTLYMNGREIVKFVMRTVPGSITGLLERNGLTLPEIDYVVFHQANRHILGKLKEEMQISDAQYVLDLADYGNTIAATIPIAFSNLIAKGKVKRGDRLVMSGFGVGLSWGNILFRQE